MPQDALALGLANTLLHRPLHQERTYCRSVPVSAYNPIGRAMRQVTGLALA